MLVRSTEAMVSSTAVFVSARNTGMGGKIEERLFPPVPVISHCSDDIQAGHECKFDVQMSKTLTRRSCGSCKSRIESDNRKLSVAVPKSGIGLNASIQSSL